MHRANVVAGGGSGRRSTVVVEESDATATSTFSGVDGREDDFAVDDGVDETTTTMIYVKKECEDDEDSKHQLQHLQQQHDANEIEDVSIHHNLGIYLFLIYFSVIVFSS